MRVLLSVATAECRHDGLVIQLADLTGMSDITLCFRRHDLCHIQTNSYHWY